LADIQRIYKKIRGITRVAVAQLKRKTVLIENIIIETMEVSKINAFKKRRFLEMYENLKNIVVQQAHRI
jgi:hypothetical protein